MSRDFRFKRSGCTKAVLLLHGLTGSPSELVYLGKHLHKAGYDVHCPILPGHTEGLFAIKQYTWHDWLDFSLREYDQLRNDYNTVAVAGLCLGATLAAAIAVERDDVSAIALMAPLIRPDGWAMPWYIFLLPLVTRTPMKFFFVFLEKGVMGVKNDRARELMKEAFAQGNDAMDCFPLFCLRELERLSTWLMKRLARVRTPMILFHAVEDDFADIRNAETIFNNVSSTHKKFVRLNDSYHMIAIDNEREMVARETASFLNDALVLTGAKTS